MKKKKVKGFIFNWLWDNNIQSLVNVDFWWLTTADWCWCWLITRSLQGPCSVAPDNAKRSTTLQGASLENRGDQTWREKNLQGCKDYIKTLFVTIILGMTKTCQPSRCHQEIAQITISCTHRALKDHHLVTKGLLTNAKWIWCFKSFVQYYFLTRLGHTLPCAKQ